MSFAGGMSGSGELHRGRFLPSIFYACFESLSDTTASNAIQSTSLIGTRHGCRVPILIHSYNGPASCLFELHQKVRKEVILDLLSEMDLPGHSQR